MGAVISLQFILATGIWIFPVEVAWMEELKQEELRIDKRSFDLIPKDIFDVPVEFLELIFDHLSFTDQIQFARCCKSLYTLAIRRPYPKARETPWLIGLTDEPTSCGRIYNQVTCYQIGAKSFKHSDRRIIGSFKGWLYVHYRSYDLTHLVNIFSNVHYYLPPLSTIKNFVPADIERIRAFAASFCRFMRPIMIAIVSDRGNLALFKIGDSKWKGHITEEKYVNLTFYKVKMYAMRREFKQVDIFKIDDNLELSLVGAIDSSEAVGTRLPRPFQAYLVVDSKDYLFLLLQHRWTFNPDLLMAIKFEIFKLRDGRQIVKVDTLDDQTVLLSDTCSEIFDVKDCLPSTFFQGNQICFTTRFEHDFGIYSINDETIKWLMPYREMYCLHWMFPRFASQCSCESHPTC